MEEEIRCPAVWWLKRRRRHEPARLARRNPTGGDGDWWRTSPWSSESGGGRQGRRRRDRPAGVGSGTGESGGQAVTGDIEVDRTGDGSRRLQRISLGGESASTSRLESSRR
uniref:Uncharacterized protein n=1 Tax=Oryza nivara TaxID=4536 RepID=A0A0E0H327_ORYNI